MNWMLISPLYLLSIITILILSYFLMNKIPMKYSQMTNLKNKKANIFKW